MPFRDTIRTHFAARRTERRREQVQGWKEADAYPYDDPDNLTTRRRGSLREMPGAVPRRGAGGDTVRAMLADKAPKGLDWVFISPAGGYGAWAAGHPETATPR